MKIDFLKNDEKLEVSLEGRLDTISAPEFESFLNGNYDANKSLVVNCEKLVYISSAGLRVLLIAQKRSKGKMKLTKVCELVMEVIEMTGFADILVIE